MRDHEISQEDRALRIAINRAKDELATLVATKEAFLADREQETEKRVKAVLEQSEAALAVIECNYDELATIRNEVGNMVDNLVSYSNSLKAERERLNRRRKAFEEQLDRRIAEINTAEIKAKNEWEAIKGKWQELQHREGLLKKEADRIKDERAKLSAALKLT